MRENFLPIPNAPNYEINSKLVCRNIKTGYILKLFQGKTCPFYSLRIDGSRKCYQRSPKCYQRSPKFLRRLAVEAAKHNTFELIPSLNYKYEINERGGVRNAKTKRQVKAKCNGAVVCIQMSKSNWISRSVKDLLWEVHGIIKPRRFRPRPCSAQNPDYGYFKFENMKDCAKFLATKVFFAFRTIYTHLTKHEQNVFGWTINYD